MRLRVRAVVEPIGLQAFTTADVTPHNISQLGGHAVLVALTAGPVSAAQKSATAEMFPLALDVGQSSVRAHAVTSIMDVNHTLLRRLNVAHHSLLGLHACRWLGPMLLCRGQQLLS